jgi:transcriptional regulator of met regulon
MTIKQDYEKILKGCGKSFTYLKVMDDERVCGQIEDLKHSYNIILCPSCSAKKEVFLERCKDELNRIKHIGGMMILDNVPERYKVLDYLMEIERQLKEVMRK